MLSENMNEVLNEQIQAEFQASYLYLAMSAYCEELNLPGFGGWLRAQGEEERVHALRLLDFLLSREGHVQLLGSTGHPLASDRPRRCSRLCWSTKRKSPGGLTKPIE